MKKINRKNFLKKAALGAVALSTVATACGSDAAQTNVDGARARNIDGKW